MSTYRRRVLSLAQQLRRRRVRLLLLGRLLKPVRIRVRQHELLRQGDDRRRPLPDLNLGSGADLEEILERGSRVLLLLAGVIPPLLDRRQSLHQRCQRRCHTRTAPNARSG